MACLPLTIAFAIGFLSHVFLDLLNKKRVQLLYPSMVGNVCLGLCYANRIANRPSWFSAFSAQRSDFGTRCPTWLRRKETGPLD